jgi:S1-C subfamily serine protease
MADAKWTFPEALQPKADEVDFNLEAAMDAMVQLRSEVPAQAFTAGILGTERTGNGVVIREDGLILTIGYLITEASAAARPSSWAVSAPAPATPRSSCTSPATWISLWRPTPSAWA